MNLMMMTLRYPDDQVEKISRNAKDGLQNQINNYQRAFEQGFLECLFSGETLSTINALPVGVFPIHYRKLLLKGSHKNMGAQELGCVNLPFMKQLGRKIGAKRALIRWLKQDKANRTVVVYSLYLPYMQAIAAVKKRYCDLKACVIITDLPNELGIASGRRGLLKQIEYAMGNNRVKLCSAFDSFVLLTKQMANALPIEGKPFVVVEGLITTDSTVANEQPAVQPTDRPAVLYTGTLNKELGIHELLDAFKTMPEYDLWLCGIGDLEAEATAAAKEHTNIKYYGFVSQKEALKLQSQAAVLINPRSSKGLFTRYSFPSKTLEYMRSGKPVLCYRLEGIPADYDDYLFYIAKEGADGICNAVRALLSLPESEREARGEACKQYVLQHKNPHVQCERILELLRKL